MGGSAARLRRTDWAYLATLGAAASVPAALWLGYSWWGLGGLLVALAAGVGVRAWSRGSPRPMPHLIRWVLFLPRGAQSPGSLQKILQPRSGERILEVGPGVGIYSLPIASALVPDGVLYVLDIEPRMLADLARRARGAGIGNIVEKQGDAQDLPYPDGVFDAAYLVYVLGEVPDAAKALRQLRRVLKPDGRLVVGEVFLDPDYVRLSSLKRKAEAAGFAFERSFGPRFGYLARFRPANTEAGFGSR